MAPVVNTLVTLLAGAATLSQVAEAKPLLSGRHAPVSNLISNARRQVHRALASYYGWEHGLSKPAPLLKKRGNTVPAGWDYFGCVSESWDERLLQGFSFSSEALTPTLCLTQCQKLGYSFGAMEYSDECYCGSEFKGSGGGLSSDSTCNMPCSGGADETCGASWFLSLYQFNATWACAAAPTPSPSTPGTTLPAGTNNTTPLNPGTGTGAGAGAAAGSNGTIGTSPQTPGNGSVLIPVTGVNNTATTKGNTVPVPTGTAANGAAAGTGAATGTGTGTGTTAPVPGVTTSPSTPSANTTQWYALGCAIDSDSDRVLDDFHRQAIMDLTIDDCLSECESMGFAFGGVEFGEQCFCGKTLPSTITYDESRCNMKCKGDASETCGGQWAVDLYELISGSVSDCTDGEGSSTATTQIGHNLPAVTGTAASNATGTTVTGTVRPTTGAATTTGETTKTTAATAATTISSVVVGTAISVTSTAGSSSATSVAPTTGNIPSASSGHVVWAHHMVGNTYPYGRSDWATDIRLAQAAGIDGFALNMGSEWWQADRVVDAYAAASGTGFKMFLSLDMTSLGCWSTSDANRLVDLVRSHANDEAQAKHNGKPIVSTFAGSDCHFGTGSGSSSWQSSFVDVLQNQYSIDIFFVPSIFSDISTFKSNTWMDGELNWNSAWPMGNNQVSTDTDNAYMNALGGKEYMSAVSPFFYTHFSPQTWNKNWLYRGDDWLYCSRWEQIIATRDKHSMTEILTWNDFGESSYISPIHGALPASSEAWVNGYDHQGLNVLTKYYATAFKTGSYPSIEKDTLVMWSRPHPHDANAPDGTGKPTGWDWTTDYVWAVVLSTGDATVTLTSGSNTQTFTVKAGLTKLKIANAVGGMSGQITRNGQTVAKYDGAGFTYTTTPSSYNYNYFVGSSS